MLTDHSGLSPFERLLTLFTRVRPGEGRSAFLFFLHGFLYAVAVTALVLMVLVPVYGRVRRRIDGERLLQAVTVFFALNLVAFAAAAAAGTPIAFGFFVWVSVFGLVVVAQLWAFAADSFNLKSGQRLFPVIMVGANLGALVGAKTAQLAVAALTPVGLMIVATGTLLATLWLAGPESRAVPDGSRPVLVEQRGPSP
ncbi:MAG: hypothetical protein MUF56_09645, partial [Solirubrobacteraceae bacterium]|nr:hypothetical protein [Solirubrobacteraceae bacterium]